MTLFGTSQENYTPNVQSPQDAAPASLSWVSASMLLPAPMAASSNNSPAHPSSSPFTAYEASFSSLLSQRTGFQLQPPQTSGLLQSSQQPFLQPRRRLTRNNPFLQSMLVPQSRSTGMTLFGASQENYTPNVQSSQGAIPASLPWVAASMPLPASMAASSNNLPREYHG